MTRSIFELTPGAKRFRSHVTRATALFALFALGTLSTLVGGATAAATAVPLGTADSFAVLAGTGVSNVPFSDITGDVGVSPTTGASITGLTCLEVTGTIYSVDATGPLPCRVTDSALLATAKTDLTAAFDNAAAQTPDITFVSGDNQLGTETLVPGVYRFGSATTANLIGNLTLSGSASDVWVFQATSSLVTAGSSTVTLTGGAQACNVFWQVGSSATLGTSSTFVGTILALTSIAVNSAATIAGRVLAQNGAVTLNNNTITRSSCAAPVATTATTSAGTTSAATTSAATTSAAPVATTATTSAATTSAATTSAATTSAATSTTTPGTTTPNAAAAAATAKAAAAKKLAVAKAAAAKKLAAARNNAASETGNARLPIRDVGLTG